MSNTPIYATILGSHSHTQTTPSAVWDVVHNLNVTAPIVDCWVEHEGTTACIIAQSVIVVSPNEVQITFSAPRTGTANIV